MIYSGGTTTVTTTTPPNPAQTNTTPYSANTSSNAPGAWGGGTFTYINGGGGSGSVNCSGQITANFTWNGGPNNDPPPTTAVVTETVNVAWGGPNSTGSSDIPNGTTPANQPPNYTATRYTVNGGGSIFTVNCTPTASMSGTSPQPYHTIGGSAYVGYTAIAYPVTVIPTGATKNGSDYDLLTGQQVTATLNAPYQVDPNSFSWSVGNVFKDYNTALASNQLVPLANADYFHSSFVFYDATSETLNLTCNATIICPDGTSLNVNPQQPIMVLKPTETAWTISANSAPDGPFYYDYDDGGNFNPQYGVQTTWNPITLTVPSPFTGGQVCLAQIGSFNRVATRVALNGASNTYVVTPATQGLDTGFPYLIAYQVDSNGNIITGNNGSYASLSPPQWSISGSGPSSGAGGDRPNTVCEPPLVSGDIGGQDWRSSTDTDQFDTWTMYRPPAVGGRPTLWVPVQTLHWAWSGSANVHTNAGGNVITHPDGNAQWYYTIPQVNPAGNPTNTTTFPTWTATIPYGLTMGPPAAH